MKHRKVFHDSKLQRKFEQDGYVTINPLSAAEIKHLIDFHDSTHGIVPDLPAYYNTADHLDLTTKYKVRDEFQSIYQPHMDRIMIDYKVIYCNYNVKKTGQNSKLYLHQDYSYADEDEHLTINAWTPLTDLHLDNSYLGVVKASNKFTSQVNGRNVRSKYSQISEYVSEKYAEKLLVNAGTVVIWNHSLLHYSPPNLSGNTRIALSNIMIPKDAQVVQYEGDEADPTIIRAYKGDEDFLIEVRPNEAIKGRESYKTILHDPTQMTQEEFDSKYKSANERSILTRIRDMF